MKVCLRSIWILPLLAGMLIVPLAPAADNDPSGAKEETKPAAPADANKADSAKTDGKTDPAAPEKITAADKRAEDEYFELYKSLADTIDQVERNYVKPVDRRELMEAAIKGIITKLDPYSSYIDPAEIGNFRTAVENQFGGIGIQITVDRGQVVISSPLVGTPAYRAGVLAGDRITKIENESTRGLGRDEIVHRLKGEAGTSVTFTVQHLGGKTETFTIRRELIHTDTVMGDSRNADDSWNFMLDPEKRIGYIRISAFGRETADDLRKAVEDLTHQKMRGLILDLRFNPGGLLTSAIEVSDLFISEGRIVSTKGRNTPEKVWDAVKPGTFEGFPMVVLVNHYSASASEIVAACLQDHDRAVIVGDRTWGKGSVQNVIELEDGKSALKLTTATYTRPNGHNIHRFPDAKDTDEWGVKPNPGMEVQLSEDEMVAMNNDRRLRDVVHGKAHEEKLADAGTAAANKDDGKSDSATADKNATSDAGGDSHGHTPANPRPQEGSSNADSESKSEKSTDGGKSDASTAPKVNAKTPASKFVDRQLQKALDYLSTELGRTP